MSARAEWIRKVTEQGLSFDLRVMTAVLAVGMAGLLLGFGF
ncbi:MAG TPA: hypothetical protein VFA94_02205 [Acidimicrobiales bacterium]|nr:hypothetical protein [Acidimicrobiales bacterium]